MLVKDLLPLVRATKHTYYNLDRDAVMSYRKDYNFLKKHQAKEVTSLSSHRAKEVTQFRHNTAYVRGITAMRIIAQGIIH